MRWTRRWLRLNHRRSWLPTAEYDESLWGSPDLTIRHVDLKKWMRDHYPEHRPGFLFSRAESISHPVITLETGQALLIERQVLKTELDYYKCQFHELQE